MILDAHLSRPGARPVTECRDYTVFFAAGRSDPFSGFDTMGELKQVCRFTGERFLRREDVISAIALRSRPMTRALVWKDGPGKIATMDGTGGKWVSGGPRRRLPRNLYSSGDEKAAYQAVHGAADDGHVSHPVFLHLSGAHGWVYAESKATQGNACCRPPPLGSHSQASYPAMAGALNRRFY